MPSLGQSIPLSNLDLNNRHLESEIDRSLSLPLTFRSSSSISSSSSSTMSTHSAHRRRSLFANGSSDEDEGDSIEFPRGAVTRPELSLIDDRDPYDNDNEHSLFIGASPVSTTAHHASKLTLNAGIFSNHHHHNDTHGMGGISGEFDPDRSVARLIRELGTGNSIFLDGEEREESRRPFGPSTGHNARSTTAAGNNNNKKPTTTTTNHSNSSQQHRPRQPSPLRKSPITAPTFYDESLMDDTPRPTRFDRESVRTARTGSGSGMGDFSTLARQMRGELDALDGAPTIDAAQERKTSSSAKLNGVGKGIPTSFTQEKEQERYGLRVESGSGRSKPASTQQRQHETTPRPRKTGTGVARDTMADLTGLTGMLETPAKGMGYKDVGKDAAVPGDGASIPTSLAALQTRLQTLQSETTTSRSRIRSLELELERIRISEAKALRSERERTKELEKERAAWEAERTERDAEVGVWRRRVGESERERDEWKTKWEKVVAEKEDLENLIIVLQDKVTALTRESESELAKIHSLRRQLAASEPSSHQQATAANGMVNQLLARVEVLEGEVERLKRVVEEAVEVKWDERRGLGVPSNKAPISRSRQSSGKSQFEEGVQAAAYDGAPRSSSSQNHREDDGHSSPTPRQSVSSRHSRRHRHRERSMHDSRSDQPQDDPSTSPFPAIRGEDLERDFFSPQRPIPTPKHGVRIADDLLDEGYGGEEHDDTAVKVAELEKALADNEGRLPPQTVVMSVLREIEDDYKHYLSIYADLADQYKRMSPLSSKRSVLAEHLKEVIDTMEIKASQVARLTSVLEVKDKTYRPPVLAAAREHKARMSFPETVRAIRKDLGRDAVRTPRPAERKAAGRR